MALQRADGMPGMMQDESLLERGQKFDRCVADIDRIALNVRERRIIDLDAEHICLTRKV
jgi:hypothetical protein